MKLLNSLTPILNGGRFAHFLSCLLRFYHLSMDILLAKKGRNVNMIMAWLGIW